MGKRLRMIHGDAEKKELKVLCLEDSPLDAELLREYLLEHSRYDLAFTIVDGEAEYLRALSAQSFHMILADYMLPGYNGLEALRAAKRLCPLTPFICVSGSIGEEAAVKLLKQGANDYVLKDKMGRLIYAIDGALAHVEEEQRTREYQEALRASEATHKAMIANISDVIAILNPDGTIRYISPNVRKWFGWEAERLIGTEIWDIIVSDRPDGPRADFFHLQEAGITERTGDYCLTCQDGSNRHIQFSLVDLTGNPDIRGWLVNFMDITERIEREAEISYLSRHDSLTGVYNRIFFESEKKRLQQPEYLPLSIIMGDINGLKLVNDAFGHEEGNHLLIETARILLGSCRTNDVIARIGGDEFCILLPNTDSSETQAVCAKIYAACDAYRDAHQDRTLFPSISIGHSTLRAADDSIDVALKNAEDFMARRKLLESRSTHSSIMSYIRTSMFEKSQETEEHAERMAMLSRQIGRIVGLPEDKLNELELLAKLHDIGKISIDANILSKPAPLNRDEWEIMKKHPEIGYRISMSSSELMPIALFIRCHHERWDGKGYPQGLAGEAIPLLSRIVSIVDTYDAMTNDRPYRKALTAEAAVAEIRRNAGSQFDPHLVKVFTEDVLAAGGSGEA